MSKETCRETPDLRDERWLKHAPGCSDCRDHLMAVEWMAKLAGTVEPPAHLPTAGFLLAKSAIRQRAAAVDRAIWPINVASLLAAILLVVFSVGAIATQPRIADVMSNGIALVSAYALVFLIAAGLVGAVYFIASYLIGRQEAG